MLLVEEFSTLCFRAGLPFVVDSGTLLGAARHRGVIPWDDDADVAMRVEDYERLRGTPRDTATLRLDADYYGEPDATLGALPAELSSEDADIAVDVVAYARDGRTLMSEAIQREYPFDCYKTEHAPGSHRYDYGPGDLDAPVAMPFFCGLVRAPAAWRERLDRAYDDLLPPADALADAARELPFDPMQCPVVPVAEFSSVAEAMRATGGRVPFLVPACGDFGLDAERFEALLAREPNPLFGYVYTSETAYDIREIAPQEALTRLRDGTLDLAIVDSPVSDPADVFPASLRGAALDDEGKEYECCFVLTRAPGVTAFHADPEFGGGYMHLIEGEKYWWFVDPADAALDELLDRPMARVLTQDGFRLWGKVQVAHLRGGGCVYFPPSWLHRVFTYRPSFGIGGYIAAPGDDDA